ncbi:hypothetical protein [Vibrio sagamiensis]|uniref:hypothetical protein n=1 Tax=Vibrio sagamiensis TaxID=512650 RepID=UPI0003A7030E|nr:hypothetical protein [Vibrio sagamiensis]
MECILEASGGLSSAETKNSSLLLMHQNADDSNCSSAINVAKAACFYYELKREKR